MKTKRAAPSDKESRFIEGLKDYNLTIEEINKSKWRYCGGDFNQHLKYYNLCYPGSELPSKELECVCGHDIKNNCYITDGKELLVLGSCCIKRFKKNCSRICEDCGNNHRNRKVNRCKDCRKGKCDYCNISCDKSYTTCRDCYYDKRYSR